MKVRIPAQIVTVDPELWALEYGVRRDEVREDVKGYFDGYFQTMVEALELEEKPK